MAFRYFQRWAEGPGRLDASAGRKRQHIGSNLEQEAATEQLKGDVFTFNDRGKAVVARVAAELAYRYQNTLVLHPPDPIVQPRVRLFSQWASPWGAWYVRAPGQRNTFSEAADKGVSDNPATPQPAPNGNDNWKDNGCFPTCLAMIVRWWAEDNPVTKGKLEFPHASGSPLDPVEMCRRLFGKPYAPCVQMAVPVQDQAHRTKAGFNDPTREWIMNQEALLLGFCSISREPRPFEGLPNLPKQWLLLAHRRYDISKMGLEDRRAVLKSALQYGPAVVCLQYPGHFVVVDAHRGHEISICDPGNILVNRSDWATPPDLRTGDLPAGEKSSAGYVQVNDQKTFSSAGGKFNGPWLMQITSVDQFHASDYDVHPEWSNLQVTH